ncbi:MAG: hypothetical protein KJ579_06915 [Verrucomicrobia bacterium]|nr:hypothetical protein [Verrucomicrobiota bacterium]
MNGATAILPFLLPLAGVGAALLLARRRRLQAAVSLALLLGGLLAGAVLLSEVWMTGRPVVFQMGGWPAPFGIAFTGDLLSATFVVLAGAVFAAGGLYAWGSRDPAVRDEPAFFPLFLALAAGLSGAFLAGDLFHLFVCTELIVISGAALTASARDAGGPEAAFKYFYISLIAGLSLLIACGVFYAAYGTLNLADLARRIAAQPGHPLAATGAVFLLVYALCKCAGVPFHFWQPDFHAAAPTPVSAMLSSVIVKLGVYVLIRGGALFLPLMDGPFRPVLLAVGIAGVAVGSLGAIGTHHAKRMLAYSTLAQVGLMLVAIAWGSPAALAAAIVLAVNHALIKSALLMIAGAMASRAPGHSAAFDALRGLGAALPAAGALFLLGGLALAGVPPMNGFIGKWMLFRSGAGEERFLVLALLAAAGGVSLIYTVRAYQLVWWTPRAAGPAAKPPAGDSLAAPALLIAMCVALGVFAEPLLRLADRVATDIVHPSLLHRAVLNDGGAP